MELFNHFRFAIVRYVPDIVREEFVNIGVLVIDESGSHPHLARFTQNWTRLIALDPDVDLEMLGALAQDLSRRFAEAAEAKSLIRDIEESFSCNLQVAPFKGRTAESITNLADELMKQYVSPPVKSALYALSGTS